MVLGFGALNIDLIYEAECLSSLEFSNLKLHQGSEIIIEDEEYEVFSDKISKFATLKKVCPGGSASNTCYMLSLLGIETALFGVLGNDTEGEYYIREIGPSQTELILRRGKTGLAYIINETRSSNPDRVILLFPRSNSEITPDDIKDLDPKKFRWVHMSSFVKREALMAQKLLKKRAYGICGLSIDPGEVYSAFGEDVIELVEGMDILFCSEKELTSIFGRDLESSLKEALGLVKMVVLKKGKEGASFYAKEDSFSVNAERVKALDTTGAGDVLDGVFLACLLRNESPREALTKAVKAASVTVREYGRDGYIQAAKEVYSS